VGNTSFHFHTVKVSDERFENVEDKRYSCLTDVIFSKIGFQGAQKIPRNRMFLAIFRDTSKTINTIYQINGHLSDIDLSFVFNIPKSLISNLNDVEMTGIPPGFCFYFFMQIRQFFPPCKFFFGLNL
jgi:hypothetical protein